MFNSSRPLAVLRSLAYLVLLGLAVTVLVGPAVAVAGALLPFALIGALAWGGYRSSRAALRRLRGERQGPVVHEGEAAPGVAPAPLPRAVAERPIRRARGRSGSLARTGWYVVVEVCCGAALGAALCVLANWQAGPGAGHPALGAAIGAVVGFVVGGSRPGAAPGHAEEGEAASSRAA
jgi:hypothetical protein